MKKFVFGLAVAACLMSGANAAEIASTPVVGAPDGKEDCYNSYKRGACKDLEKFKYVLKSCKKDTVPNCLEKGCNKWKASDVKGLEAYVKDRCSPKTSLFNEVSNASIGVQKSVNPAPMPVTRAPSGKLLVTE